MRHDPRIYERDSREFRDLSFAQAEREKEINAGLENNLPVPLLAEPLDSVQEGGEARESKRNGKPNRDARKAERDSRGGQTFDDGGESYCEYLDEVRKRDEERGLESNPYSYEEYEARRAERNED